MPECLFDKSKDIELIPPKNTRPTAEEMRAVACRHSPEEWAKLCESENFMNLLCTDIPTAKRVAKKILAGKGDILTKTDK